MVKFSHSVMKNLERFIEMKDTMGVETIWTCCITCLGHLAALCHLVGQAVPAMRGSMGDLCDLALDKLASLSYEVHIERYSHFDFLTGVRILVNLLRTGKTLTKYSNQISWKRALDTIDERIESRPHAGNEPLRHWRGVIGKAYADFQASFPGYQPSPLTSLVLSVDGRTEDSSYPNLLLQEEREHYGL